MPLVPVMVTDALPIVAVLEAAKVSVLVAVAATGLKVAVTPAGRPLAERLTVPVNPPERVMVTVLVPVLPRLTVAFVAVMEKSDKGPPVIVSVKVAA